MEVWQSLSGPIPAQFDADAARYERGEQERQDGDGCQRPDDRVVSVGHVGHELPDVHDFAVARQQRRNYTVSQKTRHQILAHNFTKLTDFLIFIHF